MGPAASLDLRTASNAAASNGAPVCHRRACWGGNRSAERGRVEIVVGTEEHVQAALVGRVRVEDLSAVAKEDVQAGQLAVRVGAAGQFVEREVEVLVESAPER